MTHKHSDREKQVKIHFKVAPTDWHDHDREAVWATPEGEGRFRLANSPFCAYGYSYEDVVEAAPNENGELVVGRVWQRGGHSTYRIMIPRKNAPQFQRYWDPLEKLGCTYERATDQFVAVDVPPTADIDKAFELLTYGETDKVWGFEESHCAHKGDDSTN